jgi:hypothetical protein
MRPVLNFRIIRLARMLFNTHALDWALCVLVNWLQRHIILRMCVCASDLVAGTLTELLEADIRTWGQGPGK